jgi:hypothetical protein
MWCIALLINTSTWDEFIHNWKLICHVFVSLHLGQENNDKEYQNVLLEKIKKIKNDSNTRSVIKSSEDLQDKDQDNLYGSNIYDYCDSDDSEDEVDTKLAEHVSKSKTKKVRKT